MTIVVTGAGGTVGSRVVRGLAVAGRRMRLLSRRPERLRPLAGPGTEVVAADFGDPAQLTAALRGARAVFVATGDPLRPEHDDHVVRAALESGVPHLVKLSALAVADPLADDLITRWQRENEARIIASGLPWTLLRPRAFMSNTLSWAPDIRASGTVRVLDGHTRNACVDPRDIAEAAVRALTGPGHQGRVYALTGPAAVSSAQQCEQLADVLGRPVGLVELSPEQARERLVRRYPEPVVEALLESARRQREGGKCRVEAGVEEATGRRPAAFRDWAGDHAELFR